MRHKRRTAADYALDLARSTGAGRRDEPERELQPAQLRVARDLLANPRLVTDRCIDTVTIDGRIISREVSRELDLTAIDGSWSDLLALDNLVIPLVKRDKDALIDNLTIRSDSGGAILRVLPRHRCQEIARTIIRFQWDILCREISEALPRTALNWYLLVPQMSVNESFYCMSQGFGQMQAAIAEAPEKAINHFFAWLRFFATNHVIWVEAKPPIDGYIKLIYSHDAQYFPERTRKNRVRIGTQMRLQAPSLRGAKSYHFRMAAPSGYFVRSQRIEADSRAGTRLTVVNGNNERPYVHLYAGQDVARREVNTAWVSVRFWEAPPWSSTRCATVGVAAAAMIGAIVAAASLRGTTVAPGAAALALSLPAAAAAWIGAPTSSDALLRLPAYSRRILVSIGILSIASALYVAVFSAKLHRHRRWTSAHALSSQYLWPLYAIGIAQVVLVLASIARTWLLRRGTKVLRSGFDSINMAS